MFHSFFKQLDLHYLKNRILHPISATSGKVSITTHPVFWMFFIGLFLVVFALCCIRPDLFRTVGDSLPIHKAHAAESRSISQDTPNLLPVKAIAENQHHSKLDDLKQKQRVAAWIAKRYRIASTASNLFVSTAYKTAFDLGLDPHLILAVMAIESRFNPYAESAVGAQGLMQVMTKVHADKFADHGGVQNALDPVVNIKVGARILRDYVKQKGSVELALKSYVGAAAMSHDGGYGSRVLSEYRMLKAVASGKRVPSLIQAKSPAKQRAARADKNTGDTISSTQKTGENTLGGKAETML